MLTRSLQVILPGAALVLGLAFAAPVQAAPSGAAVGNTVEAALALTGDGASAQQACTYYSRGRRHYRPGPCHRGPRYRRY